MMQDDWLEIDPRELIGAGATPQQIWTALRDKVGHDAHPKVIAILTLKILELTTVAPEDEKDHLIVITALRAVISGIIAVPEDVADFDEMMRAALIGNGGMH